ncbi:MAG: hypothetical protein AAFP02_26705, partial [Bacteroidota bacterium]
MRPLRFGRGDLLQEYEAKPSMLQMVIPIEAEGSCTRKAFREAATKTLLKNQQVSTAPHTAEASC